MTQEEKYRQFIEDAKEAILKSSEESSVYLGCDSIVSKKNGTWMAKYSTVIVVHKDSKHGCQIFHHSVNLPDYRNLKQRLMNESNFAIQAAFELVDILDGRSLSIHLDLNPDPRHKSNIAVKEAIGWVRGSLGIDPVIKPDAWCATHAADHIVRNKNLN